MQKMIFTLEREKNAVEKAEKKKLGLFIQGGCDSIGIML
jgi:hypothetical protein